MMKLTDDGGTVKWSREESLLVEWASTTPGVVTNYRTVAVADINNDKQSDIIVEKEIEGGGKTWLAFLADTDASSMQTFTRDPTRIPTPSRSEEYMAIGLLDYDDSDLSNLPDLLFRRMNMASGMYEIRVAVNTGTDFDNSAVWYSNTEMPGIIGLEEDGLTALANDTSELIAWAGDTRLQTRHEFSEWLRLERGLELLDKTVLDLNPEIGADKCVLGYGDTDTDSGDSLDGFNQYQASGKMALLACNYQALDGRVTIKMQAVYGGCAGTAGVAGIGARCEVGLFKASTEFIISEEPPVSMDAEVSGPKASGCAEVTLTNFCAGAQASLADASVGAEVGGVGASTGVSAGSIGGRLQAGWEDGAITASVGVEFLVGVEFEVSINPEEVGETIIWTAENFVVVGETSFTWAKNGAGALEDGGGFVIYTAGPAIYGAAGDVADGAYDITQTAAGEAIKFFDRAETDAKQVFVLFVVAGNLLIDEVFDELANMAAALEDGTFGDYASGKLLSAADTFLSGASSIWRTLSPF